MGLWSNFDFNNALPKVLFQEAESTLPVPQSFPTSSHHVKCAIRQAALTSHLSCVRYGMAMSRLKSFYELQLAWTNTHIGNDLLL